MRLVCCGSSFIWVLLGIGYYVYVYLGCQVVLSCELIHLISPGAAPLLKVFQGPTALWENRCSLHSFIVEPPETLATFTGQFADTKFQLSVNVPYFPNLQICVCCNLTFAPEGEAEEGEEGLFTYQEGLQTTGDADY